MLILSSRFKAHSIALSKHRHRNEVAISHFLFYHTRNCFIVADSDNNRYNSWKPFYPGIPLSCSHLLRFLDHIPIINYGIWQSSLSTGHFCRGAALSSNMAAPMLGRQTVAGPSLFLTSTLPFWIHTYLDAFFLAQPLFVCHRSRFSCLGKFSFMSMFSFLGALLLELQRFLVALSSHLTVMKEIFSHRCIESVNCLNIGSGRMLEVNLWCHVIKRLRRVLSCIFQELQHSCY